MSIAFVRRALVAVSVICWLFAIAAWFPASVVERQALQQPAHQTEQFTEPLRLKGVVRYVSPAQRNWYVGAKYTFHAGWIIGALAAIAVLVWDRRRNAIA